MWKTSKEKANGQLKTIITYNYNNWFILTLQFYLIKFKAYHYSMWGSMHIYASFILYAAKTGKVVGDFCN